VIRVVTGQLTELTRQPANTTIVLEEERIQMSHQSTQSLADVCCGLEHRDGQCQGNVAVVAGWGGA
jgi:hypothetical protein